MGKREKAAAIIKLRGKTSQKDFAESLGVTQPMVSAWEHRRDEPSSELWLKIANKAPSKERLWFWRQAGITEEAILEAAVEQLRDIGKRPPRGKVIAVPAFQEKGEVADKDKALWYVDARLVPAGSSPAYYVTGATDIQEGIGIQLPPGTMLLLDTSGNGAKNLEPFWDHCVVVEERKEDNRGFKGSPRRALSIGWLRCEGAQMVAKRYAVLEPIYNAASADIRSGVPSSLTVGRWDSISDEWKKQNWETRVPHMASDQELFDTVAREELRLLEGYTILGCVLGWFVQPQI